MLMLYLVYTVHTHTYILVYNSCHLHCHTRYICFNVAATFVSNEHTVIIKQSTNFATIVPRPPKDHILMRPNDLA